MKNPSMPISIVVADDHPVVLHGIAGILQSNPDLEVVAACSDGAAAVEAIRKLGPRVAVLDIAMPGMSGLDVLSAIAADGHRTKVVFLTAAATDDQILAAIARGASGILLKDAAPNDLVNCVMEVAAGRPWLPPDVIDAALERETGRRLMGTRITESLTVREREVMLLVSEGLSNKHVGRRLKLTEGTVKMHLHNIYQKFGVANRTALTVLAISHRDQLVASDQRKPNG
jgi:two-component system nitrate/nitrite response regulator NarL